MSFFQKSEFIKERVQKGFQDGSSKTAKRKCYGYNVDSHGDLFIDPEVERVSGFIKSTQWERV